MKFKTKYIIMGVIIAVALCVDLVTKHLFHDIEYTKIIPNIIAFQTNGGNTGAAFGLFSKSTTFLIVLSVIVVVCMIFVDIILKINTKTYAVGFGLILAGAVGNFIDRIALGYVRDFIMFDFWKSFPIFNFADCCIVIGAVLVCVHFIFLTKSNSKEVKKNGTN
ncbi:MAG: signal peptidase II [Clostridia bacterium]|nr:signal peptidase II [Clostridia bacterium]